MTLTETIERYSGKPAVVIPIGFAAALLFVLFGPYSNYSMIGHLDPWVYTGYFTNYSNLQNHYGDMYYFSRLPWTLPGLLAFQLASPVVACIALNTCMVATSAVSLYFAIRWHYGTAAALLTSLTLATNPYFYNSIAWNYPNGPAITYGFLAAAFALRPNGRHVLNTFLVGVFLALAGFTNMSAAPMILSILVFPAWQQRRSIAGVAREAAYVGAGVVATTAALFPVSKLVLGYWLFFMRQIYFARYEMGTPGVLARMWGSGNGFLLNAYRLFPPAFVLVFGLAVLLIVRPRKGIAWPAWVALLVCCLLYAYQEFGLHGAALRVFYVSAYLVVPLFVFSGAIIGELWQRAAPRHHWAAVAAPAFFVIALPFVADACRYDLYKADLWSYMLVAGIAALMLLAGWRSAPAVFRIPTVLMLASLLYAGPARELNVFLSMHPSGRADFETMMNLQAALKSSIPPERHAVFWVDAGEFHADLFASAQALWVFEPFDFTHFLSTAPAPDVKGRMRNKATLVHLTDHPEKIADRLKLLDSRGVHYGNDRQWTVPFGQKEFYVAAEDVTDVFSVR